VVFAFVTLHHAKELETIDRVIARDLAPAHVIAIAGEGLACNAVEIEAAPAVSLLACELPGVRVTPFDDSAFRAVTPRDRPALADAFARAALTDGAHRCSVVLADPFSHRTSDLLAALEGVPRRRGQGDAPARAAPLIVGGLASGAARQGEARVLLDGRARAGGFVGLSLAGPIDAQAVVSQGCKPLGPPMVVTSATGPIVRRLGGRRALEVLRELIDSLDESRRRSLGRGLMLGLAVSEYRDRFGRGDFVIRAIPSVNEDEASITVADAPPVGTTVQFHVRDDQTAQDDLRMLMDAQALHARPAGALLFTCSARGTRLFGKPHHDASCVQAAFAQQTPGEHAAKAGTHVAPGQPGGPVPLAGFFAGGEIGPALGTVRLHTQTACALLLRAAQPEPPGPR
jgi:small ligand-binding sensory domain FIST